MQEKKTAREVMNMPRERGLRGRRRRRSSSRRVLTEIDGPMTVNNDGGLIDKGLNISIAGG